MIDETRKAAYDFITSDLFRALVGSPAFLECAHAFEERIEAGEEMTMQAAAALVGLPVQVLRIVFAEDSAEIVTNEPPPRSRLN